MAFHIADFQVEAISCDQGATHAWFQQLMVITLPEQYGLACIFITLQKVWLECQKGGLSGTHMPLGPHILYQEEIGEGRR